VDAPSIDAIAEFLHDRFDRVSDVAPLKPGGWSSAYEFRSSGRDLVLRLGPHRADFDKEKAAAQWRSPLLPIPEVLDLGDVFDGSFIVSQRHFGVALADASPDRVDAILVRLFDVLVAMREITLPGRGFGIWLGSAGDAPAPTWAAYLNGARDRDETRLIGWRQGLLADAEAHDAFHRGCDLLSSVVDAVPNVRRVVHADLLLNHLVAPDDSITAVFDWGNSLAGDPLYDVAWILYCIPWFPAIRREQVISLARALFDEPDLNFRLAVYELHIAVSEMQYVAYLRNTSDMREAVKRTGAKAAALALL
jgi:hygromycin-B 4-O-kinase